MSRHAPRVDDLLVSSNFIRAVRESGYLSISTAIAELVDNSLQASASEVAISISRDGADALPEIVVEDNGVGADPERIRSILDGTASGQSHGIGNVADVGRGGR